ncbi:hypothetical protein J2TS6_34670 [Paenibacillus albilobatus]|uniref:PsbP C-terminal domain-containing protein n=1 Tax=Paenibacillus albilobatus TaxID=2716884 RepID=A0A919XHJ7_9BACL|nr:PsbP-related protein [Paenibacillus albilobatus]GIO32326.1 hypothetical protein J2TS6_34670 [Paenibacillus albilobatus]
MKKSIVLLLSLALVLSACGSKEKEKAPAEETKTTATQEAPKETPKEPEEQKMATAETEEFAFSYPASWQAFDLSQLNQPAIKAAYVDPAPKVAFADNVNVAADNSKLTAKENADQVVAQYESGALAASIKDFKKISYTDAANNGGILVGEYTNAQSGVPVVLTQYIVPTGNSTYTMTISYGKESYDNGGKETVQKMIDSFKLSSKAFAANGTEKTSVQETTAKTPSGQTQMADVMVQIIPSVTDNAGEMTEKTYNYIVSHKDLFPAVTADSKKAAKASVDASITSRHLFKNITPYLDKMVQVSGQVIDIEEEETEIGTIAIIHVGDENDNSIVGLYMNATGDILEGDEVTMVGLPTSLFSFDNVGGGTTNAILMSVSTVQKK